MSDLLSADAILGADDLGTETVEVPEWGGHVRVRGLTVSEQLRFSKRAGDDMATALPELIAIAAIDAKGAPLFPDRDEATAILATKSRAAIERVAAAVLRLSGLTEEDAAGN